jgi:hypothetical protein
MLGGMLVPPFVANWLVRFTGVLDVIILMFTGCSSGRCFPNKGMLAGALERELPAL